MVPAKGDLQLMFNPFHNHVVETLAQIDEGGRFSKILNPIGKVKADGEEKLYDEALFQTARLVTCGLYINIILKDYVRTILNLNRVDTLWNLDPRSEDGRGIFGHKIPEATGNAVSAEFNLVYRWHSCVSQRDEEWTKEMYTRLVGTDRALSMNKFLRALTESAAHLSPDPLERDFAGLQRLADGSFRDEDLANIWTASVCDIAGSYGANHVPEILKNIEVLGIMQSRSWNLASLNEFRAYFKLVPHKTFEDINADPLIAEQLRHLYGHPDNVELYPGIVVESAKEPIVPGSGLCANFSISRAILSDAVALVRGDRFYTTDYTPSNLTNWGFNEAGFDLDVNYGCVLYKLVLNALPNSYEQNSIFAHYPLVVPEENTVILAKLQKASLYNFDVPTKDPPRGAEAHKTVTNVSPSPPLGSAPGLHLAASLLENEGLFEAAGAFYKSATVKLLQSQSYELAGLQYVDVVDNVFNIAHAQFVTELFLLPDQETSELIALLSTLHGCSNAQQPGKRFVFLNRDGKEKCSLLDSVQSEATRVVKGHHDIHLSSARPIRQHGMEAVQGILKKGLSPEDISSAQLVPLAASIFISQARVFAETLDQVLAPGHGPLALEDFKEKQADAGTLSTLIVSHANLESLGGKLAASTTASALKVICDLKEVRRAAGSAGKLRRIKEDAITNYLNMEESTVMMYPTTMKISWVAN